VQTLYEKKLLTYPRTDSQYLTADMKDTAASITMYCALKMPYMEGYNYTPGMERVINDAKVSDHHASAATRC